MESSESSSASTNSSSGSKTFGLDARNTNDVNPRSIKSFAIKIDGKGFDIYFPNTLVPEKIIEKAQLYSPLLIDQIGKGIMRKTRRKSVSKSKTAKARERSGPKLIKEIKHIDEPVVYTWMLITDAKFRYYLVSNKVQTRQEIGTTHANLEKRYTDKMGHPPHRIYLTGEFHITPTTITYNFISGTYMRDKMTELEEKSLQETNQEQEDKYTKPIDRFFNTMLEEYFNKFSIVRGSDTKSFIPTNNPNITEKELAFLHELFGEEWDTYVKPAKKSLARVFGIQIQPKTAEQIAEEEEKKRIKMEQMLKGLSRK